MGVMQTEDAEAKEKKAGDMLAMLEKEIEPLLKDAKPFFGGSERTTMAEVSAGPSKPLVFQRACLHLLKH